MKSEQETASIVWVLILINRLIERVPEFKQQVINGDCWIVRTERRLVCWKGITVDLKISHLNFEVNSLRQ